MLRRDIKQNLFYQIINWKYEPEVFTNHCLSFHKVLICNFNAYKHWNKYISFILSISKFIIKPNILQIINGGEFNNEEMKVFLKNQTNEYIRDSPYHFQCQGAVQRFNRIIQNFYYLYKDMNLD